MKKYILSMLFLGASFSFIFSTNENCFYCDKIRKKEINEEESLKKIELELCKRFRILNKTHIDEEILKNFHIIIKDLKKSSNESDNFLLKNKQISKNVALGLLLSVPLMYLLNRLLKCC